MRVAENPSCVGCPLYGDGSQQFHPDQFKHGAAVEVRFGTPEESRSGLPKLERDYYKLAELAPERVSISHAVRCGATLPAPVKPDQWEKGKRGVLEHGVRFCDRVHSGVGRVPGGATSHLYTGNRSDVRLVATLGDLALQSATGQRSSHEWRGWLLPYQSKSDSWLNDIWTPGPGDLPVLAMVPLGDLYGQPTLTYPMRADWKKAKKVLQGAWPQPFPGYETRPPAVWPRLSAFDTEFPQGVLERYSLYDGRTLWVIEAHDVRELVSPGDCTVIFHNIEADIAYLQGFLKGGRVKAEDSMLAHSVQWSDLPHTLEFGGSIFARINRWKHLFYKNPKVYSGGDALGTWDFWFDGIIPDFRTDPQSVWVYRNCVFPLTHIIMEAETVGLRVVQDRVETALEYHAALRDEAELEAQAYCGYPVNLGSSDQVGRWLFEVEGVGVKRGKR